MHELDRRIDALRSLLADVRARREQTEHSQAQVRAQMDQMVDYTVTHRGALGNALAALADLDERLTAAATTARHLELLRRRAQQELDALLVTRDVMEAHARLDELEQRRAQLLAMRSARTSPTTPTPGEPITDAATPPSTGELGEIEAEMAELRATIEAASEAAARALTASRRSVPGVAGTGD